ncbi:DUF1801 domain-containing protein [bacterium SCSIO 12741]|nr:DUF1801 domain-containing protein [bacterium SCSIO 12741]
MAQLVIKTNPEVEQVFAKYPEPARSKMLYLRELVRETAEETEDIDELEETLKWGEPSFVTKNGSTLRMDWKSRSPDEYALYFQCTSRLVDTFRMVFDHEFHFDGKRAIVFHMNEDIPVEALKECIKATLRYHKVKHLMTLGV